MFAALADCLVEESQFLVETAPLDKHGDGDDQDGSGEEDRQPVNGYVDDVN
jgi:hypothetical protein